MTESLAAADERWVAVPGWTHYEVSDLGRIRQTGGRVLKGLVLGTNYRGIILCSAKVHERRYLHDLVLTAFVGPRPPGFYACHNNGVRDDNRLTNLRWDTPSANNRDQITHGTNHEANKTHCPRGHALTAPNLVESERRRGHRKCRACNQARAVAQRRRTTFDTAEADARYALLMGVVAA